jgi:hypothetical protein
MKSSAFHASFFAGAVWSSAETGVTFAELKYVATASEQSAAKADVRIIFPMALPITR